MKIKNKTKWLVYTALMTALTAVATIVIQVPSVGGGYTNLSDSIIFLTAVMMDPVAAMIAGGIGTMLADLYLYPATMFFSLAFHGAEGLIVGLLIRFCLPKKKGKTTIAIECVYMLIGGLVMMGGYFMAKSLGWYGTKGDTTAQLASAFTSLWRNSLQVVISIVAAYLLLYPLRLKRLVNRYELYGETDSANNSANSDAASVSTNVSADNSSDKTTQSAQ